MKDRHFQTKPRAFYHGHQTVGNLKAVCVCVCSVIGTPFYLMRYVPGRIFKNPSLAELGPKERRDYFTALCKTLAAIHSVDLRKANLQDFGKEG